MNASHGVMFHHFHDEIKHIKCQGSLTAGHLKDMLDYYEEHHNLISAEEYLFKSRNDRLRSDDVCLTFDDGLLCQYEIAYPVLSERGLTAFWFVYTSPLDGILERLEIYHHFRFSIFSDIEEFYEEFFDLSFELYPKTKKVSDSFEANEHFCDAPFYTYNDKLFRFLRDETLGEDGYNHVMESMIKNHKYDVTANAENLWMKENNIEDLFYNGNIIGLHSYSHPTVMAGKSYLEQKKEYRANKEQIESIIGGQVCSVSYPCNSYNEDTIKCMRDLGIILGFRDNMSNNIIEDGRLELPRQDHANIIREMGVEL